jgi:hypothetical protein
VAAVAVARRRAGATDLEFLSDLDKIVLDRRNMMGDQLIGCVEWLEKMMI